ncbi:MAG: GFA family protein [Pseudomonadota bacterium]
MAEQSNATGSCLCGAVKIKVTADHKDVGVCHCDMCRRWSSGPLMALEVGQDVEIDGEDHVTIYRSSDWAERGFCKTCGSNLFYRIVGSGDHYLSAGLIDGQGDMVFTGQVFIDEKPEFYSFANQTKTMTGAELFAMFAPPTDKP